MIYGRPGSIFVLLLLFCGACSTHRSMPAYPLPARMTIVLEPVIDLGLAEKTTIECRSDDITKLYTLIKPTRRIDSRINKSVSYLVAQIISKYPDGSSIYLFIRYTGKNPLAVSFDDTVYYYADDGMLDKQTSSDGVVDLLRFLKKQYPDKF